MARKHSRRERKHKHEHKKRTPASQLLQQGRQKLEEGDSRQALDYFKRAQSEDGNLKGLNVLLFCAYSQRARQLATKGMTSEAAVMRKLADGQCATVDPQALSAGDFVRYIRHLKTADVVQLYTSRLGQQELAPEVEQALADQLLASRHWEALAVLDHDHPLRRDAEVVKPAITFMDAGDWEQAGTALAGISRRSPFAPWRIFCKAMVCVGAGDKVGLRQAIDLLPKHFILSQTVNELRSLCAPGTKAMPRTAPTPVQQALGTETLDREQLAANLIAALRQNPPRWHQVERLLPPLAKAIYPEDPVEACVALLEIIGIGGRLGHLPLSDIVAMRRLLPQDRAQAVAARIELVNQHVSHGTWNVASAATYLAHQDVEFPDARQQALVRARILEFLARSGHTGGACPHCVGAQVIKTLWNLTGAHSNNQAMIFADLMLASLESDPDNREGYRFLVELLRSEPSTGPKVERVLTEMASRFRDDPDPCVELAVFHFSRNAYRKAEAALEEARRRAPYDERLLDKQAIGYLKSADQSRNRRNYALAERDLQRTEALRRRRLSPILLVKRLGLKLMCDGGDAMAEIEHRLSSLSPFEQMRTLSLLILDLTAAKNVGQHILASLMKLLSSKRDMLDQLDAGEVIGLLAPIDEDFKLVFPDLQVAPVLADWATRLLAMVEDDHLIAIFDILLACQNRSAVRAEIRRRLKGLATSDQYALLRFYLAVICHIDGETDGSQSFKAIVDVANPALKERLRAAAARLARYTHGPLREALQQFNFDILDSPFTLHGEVTQGFEELLPDLIELPNDISELLDDDDDEDDQMDELEDLEQMLDEAGVRGASLPMLQDFVGYVRSDPRQRRELDQIARAVEEQYDDLSRELRVLLFPKRKGRSRQRR